MDSSRCGGTPAAAIELGAALRQRGARLHPLATCQGPVVALVAHQARGSGLSSQWPATHPDPTQPYAHPPWYPVRAVAHPFIRSQPEHLSARVLSPLPPNLGARLGAQPHWHSGLARALALGCRRPRAAPPRTSRGSALSGLGPGPTPSCRSRASPARRPEPNPGFILSVPVFPPGPNPNG